MQPLSEEQAIPFLALVNIPGVGAITARQLISYCGGPAQVFETGLKKLLRIPGIGEHVTRQILTKSSLRFAEEEYKRCMQAGVRLSCYPDATYPARLKPLYDAPLVLYSAGAVDWHGKHTVGIVGTRKITEYGKSVTETIIRELAPFNPVIVSGLAYGVDIAAHRACLKNNLSTLGVMASGIDIIYPRSHEKTARQMRETGGIVTENPMGTHPDFQRFPARNRIIAGLSDVLIVVESALKGGSLITVEFAQNYHREVFAVPGALNQPMSEGCNALIRQNKAGLFTSVEAMVADLGWGVKKRNPTIFREQTETSFAVFDGFSVEEGQLLALLRTFKVLQIDELSWHSGIHPGKLATLLLSLEFQGVVRSLPGKKYTLL